MTFLILIALSLDTHNPPVLRLPIPVEIPASDDRLFRTGWELLYSEITDELIEGVRQWRVANPDYPIQP